MGLPGGNMMPSNFMDVTGTSSVLARRRVGGWQISMERSGLTIPDIFLDENYRPR
jgi:hypothetical protein